MKLDRIHQISEIIASVAIVASLIFVGVQVSQNTDALETNAAQINSQSWQNISLAQAANPQLMEAYYQNSWVRPFDSVEQLQALYLSTVQLKSMEFNYLQWRDGKLSDDIFEATRNGLIIGMVEQPMFEWVLSNQDSPLMTKDFLAFARDALAEAKQRRAAMEAAQSTNQSE